MQSAKGFDHILDWIITFTSYVAGALLIFSWLSVCTEVICRYFLGRPIVWVVEVTEYILVQITFLGSAWLLKREGHVSVDLVVSHLSPKIRSFFLLITSMAGTLICLILTCWGAVATWGAYRDHLIIPKQLGMPKYLVMIVIPIGCFLLSCQFLRRIRGAWAAWKTSENRGGDSAAAPS
ncbi:MAG: TRAP transporter small permease [Pseudomonadota bacterium]